MNALVAVFAAISALGGLSGLAAFAYVSVTRRKINAEANKLDVDAGALVSQQALEMYDRLRLELKEARLRIGKLEGHVRDLEDVLRRHGINPPSFRWPPLESVDDDSA